VIDAADPLSFVLWLVFAFAAGLYPLGFMLGSSCSECCGVPCTACRDYFEFKRCVRFEAKEKKTRSGSHVYKQSDSNFFPDSTEPFVAPLHGFSRSIGRPEDVGAKRVAAEADITVSVSTYGSTLSSRPFPFDITLQTGDGTEVLYTWTVESNNSVQAVTTTKTGEKTSTISYPAAEVDELVAVGGNISIASLTATVKRESHVDYGADEWTNFLSVSFTRVFAVATIDKVCITAYEYWLKVADVDNLRFGLPNLQSQQDWVYDQEEIIKFLNGESPQTYKDKDGVEWSVRIQGDTPLCGLAINNGANSLIPHMVTAELPSECPGKKWTYDAYGCMGSAESVLRYPLVKPSPIWAATAINAPDRMTYNSWLYPNLEATYLVSWDEAIQSCEYEFSSKSCTAEGDIYRRVRGSAFFCGDLLWTVENGPCNTSIIQARKDGLTETYTLNMQKSPEATSPHGTKMCPAITFSGGVFANNTVYGMNSSIVTDYYPSSNTCWPSELKFVYATHDVCPGYAEGFRRMKCDGSDWVQGTDAAGIMIAGCPEGWQAGQTQYTAKLWYSPSCSTALYAVDGYTSGDQLIALIKKTCNDTFEIANPPSYVNGFPVVEWPDRPWIKGWVARDDDAYAQCSQSINPRDLKYHPMQSVSVVTTQQPWHFYVKSVTPSEVPASGGVVTVVTGGVQDKTTQHTIAPNKSRFSITRKISPYYTRRITSSVVNGSGQGISYTDFTPQLGGFNLPQATVIQKGYGGDDDEQCTADAIWINAAAIYMPNQLLLNQGSIPVVYADFTKENCLVCQPTTLEGKSCEWTATGSEAWMKIDKKDGLFTLTIDPDVKYTLGPVCNYTSGLTGTVTVTTKKESKTWTVCIKMQ